MNNRKNYDIEDFNPCIDCKDCGKNCTGIDGGEWRGVQEVDHETD